MNSLLKRPIPAAPALIARSTSSTEPALHISLIPSKHSRMLFRFNALLRNCSRVSESGSSIMEEFSESMSTLAPFLISVQASTPTAAAIPRPAAMMQTWEVLLPFDVTKAATLSRSISAVSEGFILSATITAASGISSKLLSSRPSMRRRSRPKTSLTSSARARRYSSSISANILHISSQAALQASASAIPSAICVSTLSQSIGSSRISRCAANTPSPQSLSAS